jgi:thiamine-phosphate pyrophosphorylase
MMPLQLLPTPILYLITSGETTPSTSKSSREFASLLALVAAAISARIPLIQIREKNLSARSLYELTVRAAALTRGSSTRLLLNDRADIARATGADGVHLTTRSLAASVVRRAFGEDFLIGVSTHSLEEARAARDGGADFAVFGPVFETDSKRPYGPPLGLARLSEVAKTLAPFPILALGGITIENAQAALKAGARGVAAIRLFNDAHALPKIVSGLRAGEKDL